MIIFDSRQTLRCLAIILVAVSAHIIFARCAAALAQARSLEEVARTAAPERLRAQRAYLAKLMKYAGENAEKGASRYWEIIRINLARRKNAWRSSGERSLDMSRTTALIAPPQKGLKPTSSATIAAVKAYVSKIENGQRIFGGVIAGQNEFPQVVSIAWPRGNAFSSFCSGTLIGPREVLTAAHCVCSPTYNGPEDARPRVVFGSDVRVRNGVRASFRIQDRFIKKKQTAENAELGDWCEAYNLGKKNIVRGQDLALLRLEREPKVATVPVATHQLIFGIGLTELTLVGFGLTESKVLGQKRVTSIHVADPICSVAGMKLYGCSVGRETVVIDFESKRDTCGGDSGGPVFIRDANGRGYYLVAATSRAVGKGRACGPGGIYSLITPRVIDWLTNVHGLKLRLCDNFGLCRLSP